MSPYRHITLQVVSDYASWLPIVWVGTGLVRQESSTREDTTSEYACESPMFVWGTTYLFYMGPLTTPESHDLLTAFLSKGPGDTFDEDNTNGV